MSLLQAIQAMKHSPVKNYAIPGLTSWLIGEKSDAGTVRLFECARDHQEPIVPHSHRFNFHCMVLEGVVTNIIWTKEKDPIDGFGTPIEGTDRYAICEQKFKAMGEYEIHQLDDSRFKRTTHRYTMGDEYSMKAHEIHSIFFGAGTKVLFFEGPEVSQDSIILQPLVEGELIETFHVQPWMFRKTVKELL